MANKETIYYGVFVPIKSRTEQDIGKKNVSNEIVEALKILKVHKDARLKMFKNVKDAEKFAEIGFEDSTNILSEVKTTAFSGPKKTFSEPTKQELQAFRKDIEEDRYNCVENIILKNPCYLVNSGDTPTCLKEGARYNALHICAIRNRAKIAELILQTISNTEYIELLHGKKDEKVAQEVCDILLDYYLNMPEKGRSETPLHLAVKFGSTDVVEVLTRFSQCKMAFNSENQLPKDIVCSRMNSPSPEVKEKILQLLEARFYVPVIRSIDNSVLPFIGEPFSPKEPPQLNTDPLSPEMEIQAYAGPMNKDQAQNFRKRWKTPPRPGVNILNALNSPLQGSSKTKNENLNFSSTPKSAIKKPLLPNRSLEFNLDNSCKSGSPGIVKLIEDTQHLNSPLNTSFSFVTGTPLRKNPHKRELFIKYREKNQSPLFDNDTDSNSSFSADISEKENFTSVSLIERHLKLSDTEKGLELIGRELAKEKNIEWKEYWDFLECFIDIASTEGLEKLENYLKIKQQQNHNEHNTKELKSLCNEFNKLLMDNANDNTIHQNLNEKNKCSLDITPINQNTNLYLCVEKSIQVFAKRMETNLISSLDNFVLLDSNFNLEVKRLNSLISNFKADPRFFSVNFNKVHSRFAQLVTTYLKNSNTSYNEDIDKTENIFMQINSIRNKISCDKNPGIEQENSYHSKCVSEFILTYLKDSEEKIFAENLQTEKICLTMWQKEQDCNCSWNLNRNNVRKERNFYVTRRLFQSKTKVTNNDEHFTDIDKNKPKVSEEGDLSDEEDIFWSDIGSEDESDVYYTPVQSPSLLEALSDEEYESSNIFLFGYEPTKRDLDVFDALFNVKIEKDKYPHIFQWKKSILKYSIDEHDNFPSPSIIRKRMHRPNKYEANGIAKRLFLSPFKRSETACLTKSPIASNDLSLMNV